MTGEPLNGDSPVLEKPVPAPSLHDPERFAEIFDGHFAEIHRYAARRLEDRDAAYDVASQTFLEAFRGRHRFDGSRGTVRSWLYGIATNLIGKHRRTEQRALRARARLGAAPPAEGHADRVNARVSAQGLRGALAGAIAALPDGERDVLLLVALADLSHEEVAAALAIPYGTVGSRLSRARKRLRKALGGTNPMLDLEEDDG